MRKFAFSFVACVASVFVAQSFAQPRDLFAEFEAEAEAAQSSAAVQAVPSSSSVAAKPAPVSSSSVKVSSSSVASSSSVELSSSSVEVSSSSIVSSSSEALSSSSEIPAAVDSSALAAVETPADVDSSLVDSTASDSVREMTPEEAYAAEMKRHNEENRIRDSLAMLASSSSATEAPSSSSMNRRELLGPVKVSKVNGIDEMKGRYKSPRKALFMSLVVPVLPMPVVACTLHWKPLCGVAGIISPCISMTSR